MPALKRFRFSAISIGCSGESQSWPSDKRIRAGERGGQRVEGFDLGDSPLMHFSPKKTEGKRLFMSTTNGTRCLERIQAAPIVLTAALTTRQRSPTIYKSIAEEYVWLVGYGWEGEYSLEDTVCAGAIVQQLIDQMQVSALDIIGNDAALAATSLYLQWRTQLPKLMCQASHGQRLLDQNNTVDIDYCAQLDILNIVPIQQSPGVLVC